MTTRSLVMDLFAIAGAFALGGCMSGPGFLKQDDSGLKEVGTTTSSEGVVNASLDGSSDLTQVVKTDSSSPVGQVELSFPPGSVAIATEVEIQSGTDLASESFANEAGLSDAGAVSSGSQAIVISSSDNAPAAQAFTVALPIPDGAALRLVGGDLEFMVVLYKVFKDGAYHAGVLPRSDITIEGGLARFKTVNFGSYQLAFTEKKVEAKSERPAETPILTKNQEKALTPFSLSLPTGVADKNRVATFTVVPSGEVARCRIQIDRDQQAPFDLAMDLGAATSYSMLPVGKDAYTIVARFECQDKNGRVSRSDWSMRVQIAAGGSGSGSGSGSSPGPGPGPGPGIHIEAGNGGAIDISNVSSRTVNLSWTAAANALPSNVQYYVYFTTTRSLATDVVSVAPGAASIQSTAALSGTSFTLTALTPGSFYYVNVLAKNTVNGETALYDGGAFLASNFVGGNLDNADVGASGQRHTFYDTVHSLHWVFHTDGFDLVAYYSANGTNWQRAAGSLTLNSNVFDVAYLPETISTVPTGVAYVAVENGAAIDLHTLLIEGTRASPTVTFTSTNSSGPILATGTFKKPSIAFDGDKLMIGAFKLVSGSSWIPYLGTSGNPMQHDWVGNVGIGTQGPQGLPVVSPQGMTVVDVGGAEARAMVQANGQVQTFRSDSSRVWYPHDVGTSGAAMAWQKIGLPALGGGDIQAVTNCSGILYVGGNFTNFAGISGANYIAQWSNGVWDRVGTAGALTSPVKAMFCDGSTLIVGGGDVATAGTGFVSRFDGISWNGSPCNGSLDSVTAITRRTGGNIYIGGGEADGTPSGFVKYCVSPSWSTLDPQANVVRAVVTPPSSTDVFVAGDFQNVRKSTSDAAFFDVVTTNGYIRSLLLMGVNQLVFAGTFTTVGVAGHKYAGVYDISLGLVRKLSDTAELPFQPNDVMYQSPYLVFVGNGDKVAKIDPTIAPLSATWTSINPAAAAATPAKASKNGTPLIYTATELWKFSQILLSGVAECSAVGSSTLSNGMEVVCSTQNKLSLLHRHEFVGGNPWWGTNAMVIGAGQLAIESPSIGRISTTSLSVVWKDVMGGQPVLFGRSTPDAAISWTGVPVVIMRSALQQGVQANANDGGTTPAGEHNYHFTVEDGAGTYSIHNNPMP